MEEKPRRIVVGQSVTEEKVRLARAMRRNMTPAEAVLWSRLRNGALGAHFRRQQVIAGFIADFYCHAAALVVETDGAVHNPAYDAERDQIFSGLGITVIRFRNERVLDQTESVIEEMRADIGEENEAGGHPHVPAQMG